MTTEALATMPNHREKRRALWRTARWALLLNAAWEFVQCPIFYEMSALPPLKAAAGMAGAVLGDAVTVLALVFIARLLTGWRRLVPLKAAGAAALLAVSFPASVLLEWIPRALSVWEYSATMPTFRLFGVSLGWLPVAQITLLPTLSLFFAMGRVPDESAAVAARGASVNSPKGKGI